MLLVLPLTLSLAMLLGGSCGGGGGGGGSSNGIGSSATGSAAIFLTDAPSDEYDRILLTIERLELIGEGGHVTIFSGEETVDLKDLENFSDLFVFAEEVPVGIYHKIRMEVAKILLVRDGPEPEVVDVPPPANGKIDLVPEDDFLVREGVTSVIELDVDAKRSIHYAETGSGRIQFRPVVFVTIRETQTPLKLARVHGEVVAIFDDQSFELCSTMFVASDGVASSSSSEEGGLGDRHRCMTVEWNDETGVFDENGDPVPADTLAVDDEVTVVGQYHMVDDNHDDAAMASLRGSGPGMPEHREHRASRSSRRDRGGDSDRDSDRDSERDEDSDETDSESDTDSETDTDTDTDGGGGPSEPDPDLVFIAYVIEIGPLGSFLTLSGTIESDVVADEFDFGIAPGQGFGDDSVVTALLQMGTAIFSKSGYRLDESDIVPDTDAEIDGVFMTDAAGTFLKTALIVLDIEPEIVDELSGEITEVDRDARSLTLLLDDSDEECVDVLEDADVFLIVVEEDVVTSERGSFDDLRAGWRADAYGGFEIGFECFEADTVIAFPEVIECLASDTCDELDFCSQEICGEIGACEPRPEVCSLEFDVVCGCDGQTYANACQANLEGTSVAAPGSCDVGGGVCTADGALGCAFGELCLVETGSCDDAAPGICVKAPSECPDVDEPVCGCDGRTYANDCEAALAGAVVESEGRCTETVCGGAGAATCDAGEVCSIDAGMCGLDAEGVCVDTPDTCPPVSDPVCGCDGTTYENACVALQSGVTVDFDGVCEVPPAACGGANPPCLDGEVCSIDVGMCDELAEGVCVPEPVECDGIEPVCGCNGETYANACEALRSGVTVEADGVCASCRSAADCGSAEVCLIEEGRCDPAAEGVCVPRPEECSPAAEPVCGCDGTTYDNACLALQDDVPVASGGSCETTACGGTNPECPAGQLCRIEPGLCVPAAEGVCVDEPDACPGTVEPVCGCDGVTYANGCVADKAGVAVEADGACGAADLCGGPDELGCEPGFACFIGTGTCEENAFGFCVAAPEECSDDPRPVCGCDGETYLNPCRAVAAGVEVASDGVCL